MSLTKEEREQKRKDSQSRYYRLSGKLNNIQYELNNLRDTKGHSRAFKMLDMSIDLMLDQLKSDHDRYVRRIRRADSSEEVSFIQKALNREKLKNTELEKQIEVAKTSSGLFINFVRESLGFK